MSVWIYSGNVYNSSPAGTTIFPLVSQAGNPIEYLQRSHIHVSTSADQGHTWVVLTTSSDYTFSTAGTEIILATGIADGVFVKVLRHTPYLDEYVEFQRSSLLTADQLNKAERFSLYVDQELSDQIGSLTSVAVKYLGSIDLTVDPPPVVPKNGDFFVNTGAGTVLPEWTGIAGDTVVGSEQVVYNGRLGEWEIYTLPVSQVGVLGVTGSAPIVVDNTDNQRPIVSITEATNAAAGSMSAADKAKLDGVETGAQANVNADWNATSGDAEILNKPAIPAAQVNADWDATSGVAEILNKPVIDPGVTQIVAGNNVTISPSGGTGVVTVNSTGGGGSSGVSSIIAGDGISVNQATGDVTITNTGGGGGGGGGTTKADIYGTAKAWATFGAGGGVDASFNVASVTKTNTGRYTVVFTNPMASADYAVTASSGSNNVDEVQIANKTANQFEILAYTSISSGSLIDSKIDFSAFDTAPAEIIVGSGTVANTNIYGTAKAWAKVSSQGTIQSESNIDRVAVSSNGNIYTCFFKETMPNATYVVNATVSSTNSGQARVRNQTVDSFQVITSDWDGGILALGFGVTVHDNEPAEVALTTFGDVINYSGAAAWATVDETTANGPCIVPNSLNVASVTRTAKGIYDVVFASPLPNDQYAVSGTTDSAGLASTADNRTISYSDRTATGFTVKCTGAGNTKDVGFAFSVDALNALPPKGGTGTDCWGVCERDGTIDASFNVASVTDTGVGLYAVVFTSPMPTSNYSVVGSCQGIYNATNFSAKDQTANGFTAVTYDNGNAQFLDAPFAFTVNATNAKLPNSFSEEEIQSVVDLAQSGATNPGLSAWGYVASNGDLDQGLNIASVNRTSAGSYAVTFAAPMPDTSYAVTVTPVGSTRVFTYTLGSQTTSGFEVRVVSYDGVDYVDNAFSFQVAATNALPPKGGTGADAWVLADSDGSISSSFNIGSVTDLGNGGYQCFFVTPMPSSNYAVNVTPAAGGGDYTAFVSARTKEYFTVQTVLGGNAGAAAFSATVNATNATLPLTVTQEQIETAINNPGASAWGKVGTSGTLNSGLNIASVTKTGTGLYDVVFATPMPSQNYSVVVGGSTNMPRAINQTATGFTIETRNASATIVDSGSSFQVFATNALPAKGGTAADAWCTSGGDGYNIASVVQSGGNANNWTVTFTTPMPSDVYSIQATVLTSAEGICFVRNRTRNGFQVVTRDTDGTAKPLGWTAVVHCTNATLPATVTQSQIDAAIDAGEQFPALQAEVLSIDDSVDELTPLVPKAFGQFTAGGTLRSTSYNIESVALTGANEYTVTFDNNMTDTNYIVTCQSMVSGTRFIGVDSSGVSNFKIYTWSSNNDPQSTGVSFVVYSSR